MKNQNNIDPNFKSIINILNKNNITYWLCHGTLLGIIRDNKLIDWDHDIDIAVWSNQVEKKKLINLMESNGFYLRKGFGIDNDVISFDKKGGRIVDINFYEVIRLNNQEIAYARWYLPKNNFMKLIDALSEAKDYKGKFKLMINSFSPLQKIFKAIKASLIKSELFYKEAGYSEPCNLIRKPKSFNFHGFEVKIPNKSEEYLRHLYGDDWKVPKKNYVWYKDANSVISK